MLNSAAEVTEVVMIWAANVPLTKFKVHNISVDLIFADFLTPRHPIEPEYFK